MGWGENGVTGAVGWSVCTGWRAGQVRLQRGRTKWGSNCLKKTDRICVQTNLGWFDNQCACARGFNYTFSAVSQCNGFYCCVGSCVVSTILYFVPISGAAPFFSDNVLHRFVHNTARAHTGVHNTSLLTCLFVPLQPASSASSSRFLLHRHTHLPQVRPHVYESTRPPHPPPCDERKLTP